jgi:hypothetical protein
MAPIRLETGSGYARFFASIRAAFPDQRTGPNFHRFGGGSPVMAFLRS